MSHHSSGDLYLYLPPSYDYRRGGFFQESLLAEFSERHRIQVPPPPLQDLSDPVEELVRRDGAGLVVGIKHGVPSRIARCSSIGPGNWP